MAIQFPTTISSILQGAQTPNVSIPSPYSNTGGMAETGSITPIVNSVSNVAPDIQVSAGKQLNSVQQWLQSKFPNTYAGVGADVSAVAQGAGEIIDQGAASWDKMSFGEKGSAVLGGAQSVYNMYNAYQQNKLADDQFQFTKDSFNKNFEASAKTTNAALADRQATRVAKDPNTYASVDDYMSKYGV